MLGAELSCSVIPGVTIGSVAAFMVRGRARKTQEGSAGIALGSDGLKRIEPLLKPIYDAILARHGKSRYYQADETRWCVFVEKTGKTGHRWWLWLFVGEDTVVYVLDPSRSHDVPQLHFPDDVEGVLMVDRYSSYKAMQQVKDGKLLLAFCWAHVRRDFVRVGKGYPELKEWALGWLRRIRDLYHLNRERLQHEIRTSEFSVADAALREHVAAMAAARDAELSRTMPQSADQLEGTLARVDVVRR